MATGLEAKRSTCRPLGQVAFPSEDSPRHISLTSTWSVHFACVF